MMKRGIGMVHLCLGCLLWFKPTHINELWTSKSMNFASVFFHCFRYILTGKMESNSKMVGKTVTKVKKIWDFKHMNNACGNGVW